MHSVSATPLAITQVQPETNLPPWSGTFFSIWSAVLSPFFNCLVSYKLSSSLNRPDSLDGKGFFDGIPDGAIVSSDDIPDRDEPAKTEQRNETKMRDEMERTLAETQRGRRRRLSRNHNRSRVLCTVTALKRVASVVLLSVRPSPLLSSLPRRRSCDVPEYPSLTSVICRYSLTDTILRRNIPPPTRFHTTPAPFPI